MTKKYTNTMIFLLLLCFDELDLRVVVCSYVHQLAES